MDNPEDVVQEQVILRTRSTRIDNILEKDINGNNNSDAKSTNKKLEEKYDFCKNWIENNDFDSKSIDQQSLSESSVYSSSAADTDSRLSDMVADLKFDREKSEYKMSNPSSVVNTESSSHSSHIDLIQQMFKNGSNIQTFGDIHVENSKNVHIGSITYFNGPIHILQSRNGNITTANSQTELNKSAKTRGNNFEFTEEEESNNPGIFIGSNLKQAIDGCVLKIIDRRTWLAQPPLGTEPLLLPVPFVIISHTATEMTKTQAETVYMVRNLQTYHIESRNWHDIGYNFLIGCDGNVYEGRGWNRVGSHTYGYNKKAIGISFVGCFINELPPQISLDALKLLIKSGVDNGYISPDFQLLAHCQCSPTESPGKRLFLELQTWSAWSENPIG